MLDVLGGVHSALSQRRGMVVNTQQRVGTNKVVIQAHLPVLEALGFAEALRKKTHGRAMCQLVFSHWQPLPGDVHDEQSKAHAVCMQVRRRKGLAEAMPVHAEFYDRI